jgi:hypothetical protein
LNIVFAGIPGVCELSDRNSPESYFLQTVIYVAVMRNHPYINFSLTYGRWTMF